MCICLKRTCLLALTLVLCACNDYEPAEYSPSPSTAPAYEQSVAALIDGGLDFARAAPVADAPAGQGFTLQAATGTASGSEAFAHVSDDRQVIALAGRIEHEPQSLANGVRWVQRQGSEAMILNSDSLNAIALLPQVAVPERLTFGLVAANAAGFVGEQLTSVDVQPGKAPFAVATAVEYQQAAQLILSVSLNAPAAVTTTLRYSTRDGNAYANQDYLPVNGELTFEPGTRSKLVTVPLLGNASTATVADKYFKLLVSGQVGPVNATVQGYGVILGSMRPGSTPPVIAASNVSQRALPGSMGEQRVYLDRAAAGLSLSVTAACIEQGSMQAMSESTCQSEPALPLFETGGEWQSLSWPNSPTNTQRYLLTNTTSFALDYTVYIFDGDIRRAIRGQVPANSQIVVYTAFAEPMQSSASSSVPVSSSSAGNSSQPALVAHTLNVAVEPQGLAATALILNTYFNDELPIASLSAELNGAAITSGQPLTVDYSQLQSGVNTLLVSAGDATGQTLERIIHIYFGDAEANTFIGDGPINIFIGQQGRDSFTGGDGTNIYLPGAGDTDFVSGSGQNIFIFQVGSGVMGIVARGASEDMIILPSASMASAIVRQNGEQNIYIQTGTSELDSQLVGVYEYFAVDGSVQSSIQRIVLADGELSAADIRRLVHTAMPGNDTYWGFDGDDTLVDIDGDGAAFGGAGNDTIRINGYAEGGDGNDVIYANHGEGGAGDDEIHAQSNATGGHGNDTLYTQDYANGEQGNDIIHGNEADNQLFGGLGDDTLYGYGGNDSLFAGEGNNTLYGGDGDDYLFAEQGEYNDNLFGGAGNDNLWGYDGDNYFDGGDGDETFFAGHGNNTVICGEGNHSFFGTDGGNDTITCGSGIDAIFLEEGNDNVDTGAGDDQVFADAGNKTLVTGAGNDEVRINGGDNCTLDAGDGDDTVYASCQRLVVNGEAGADLLSVTGNFQLEVSGGLGDDTIRLDGRPYVDNQLIEAPFTHIYWSPGEGSDIYSISGYEINSGQANELPLTKSSDSASNANSAGHSLLAASDFAVLGMPTTHFYLGGSATLANIRFEKADGTSLLMHYLDATTGLSETLTFEYWFNRSNGKNELEQFYDFILPDLSSLPTATISEYFNRFYHRAFNDEDDGLAAVGMPVGSDKTVISGASMLVDSNNYLVRQELAFNASNWTIELWVAMPELLQAVTPIMQWGAAQAGSDGFGLALIDSGEGYYWSLQNGEANTLVNTQFDTSGAPQHIAIVNDNNQLTLFINGQPSSSTINVDYSLTPRLLSLGYFNSPDALTIEEPTRWHLDELLIHYDSAQYTAAFTPQAVPFVAEYLPAPADINRL